MSVSRMFFKILRGTGYVPSTEVVKRKKNAHFTSLVKVVTNASS